MGDGSSRPPPPLLHPLLHPLLLSGPAPRCPLPPPPIVQSSVSSLLPPLLPLSWCPAPPLPVAMFAVLLAQRTVCVCAFVRSEEACSKEQEGGNADKRKLFWWAISCVIQFSIYLFQVYILELRVTITINTTVIIIGACRQVLGLACWRAFPTKRSTFIRHHL